MRILNSSIGSLRLNFDIIRTPGSIKSVTSSVCTFKLNRSFKTGFSFRITGEVISWIEDVNCSGDKDVVLDDINSDVSLIVVNSRSGAADSVILWFCIVFSSDEGVPTGDNGT